MVGAVHALVPAEGMQIAKVVGPDGRERKLEVHEGQLHASGLDRPGAYRVLGPEGRALGELAFSVRIDPLESDTRRLRPEELQAHLGGGAHAAVEQRPVSERKRQTPVWSVLAALAILAFCAEGALIRR